jgi:hypothetical protein
MANFAAMKQASEKLDAKLSNKINDLSTKVDKMVRLVLVATQLAAIPEKVVTLRAATFENTEQVVHSTSPSSACITRSTIARAWSWKLILD